VGSEKFVVSIIVCLGSRPVRSILIVPTVELGGDIANVFI